MLIVFQTFFTEKKRSDFQTFFTPFQLSFPQTGKVVKKL
jgi:hypothetical protein